MAYVEFLRVRRTLLIFLAVGAFSSVVSFSTRMFAHHGSGSTGFLPVALLFALAGILTWIVASILGPSINSQRVNVSTSWTKPMSRERMAAQIMAVDVAGILIAFVIALGLYLVPPLLLSGVPPSVVFHPAEDLTLIALMLGTAVMFYGLIQALTAWNQAPGGVFSGLAWPFFLVVLALGFWETAPPLLGAILHGLQYVDPFSYVSFKIDENGFTDLGGRLGLSIGARAVLAWAIGIVACAIAAFSWKRLEA